MNPRTTRRVGRDVPSPAKPAALPEEGLDILSDVLGLRRMRGEVLCWSELSAPWGLGFAPDQALFFHVIQHGACLLERDGSKEVIELRAGDLAVLPEGCGHQLRDSSRSRVVPVMSLVDPPAGIPGRLRAGGGGAETQILCGRFRFDERLRTATLPGLPWVLHVGGSEGARPEWLDLTVRFLTAEVQSSAPGRDLALSRLIDLLFVQTIRTWLSEIAPNPSGWIGALRDPRIGAGLALMHASPERPWDVGTLAAEVGMSRSSFAQHFVELVGEPPSRYLTRWRMHVAARILRAPGASLTQTAERVGYHSVAAFSRVFKRYMRAAPAVFRHESAPPSRGSRKR